MLGMVWCRGACLCLATSGLISVRRGCRHSGLAHSILKGEERVKRNDDCRCNVVNRGDTITERLGHAGGKESKPSTGNGRGLTTVTMCVGVGIFFFFLAPPLPPSFSPA